MSADLDYRITLDIGVIVGCIIIFLLLVIILELVFYPFYVLSCSASQLSGKQRHLSLVFVGVVLCYEVQELRHLVVRCKELHFHQVVIDDFILSFHEEALVAPRYNLDV